MVIAVGAAATIRHVTGIKDTAAAMRSGSVEVLATPRLVALVEQAAVAALAPSLPVGTTSVGNRIDLRHLAPSRIGTHVVATAEVTGVDGNRIRFDVHAEAHPADHGPPTTIARGTHTRVLVAEDTFAG